jgi:hypothetical protein
MNADIILRWSSAGHDTARRAHGTDAANRMLPMSKAALRQPVRHGESQLRALIEAVFASSPRNAANFSSTGLLQSP